MPIPETQFDTWAKQGSITGSSTTYNAIREVLNDSASPYWLKDFDIFLQGSYGNDTNIYSESDVDIVIQLKSAFEQDLDSISESQKRLFHSSFDLATYGLGDFKRDVLAHLQAKFGSGVVAGNKAIAIPATSSRRKADVIVALEYRRYTSFTITDRTYVEGIKFYNASGGEIINYPKPHSSNLTRKHQSTGSWLKPMVRIFKNIRSRLEAKGKLAAGEAPSYFLEGMLYNVPSGELATNYATCFRNILEWLEQADKTQLLCANEQYYLLRWGSETCWNPYNCEKFLAAAAEMWDSW